MSLSASLNINTHERIIPHVQENNSLSTDTAPNPIPSTISHLLTNSTSTIPGLGQQLANITGSHNNNTPMDQDTSAPWLEMPKVENVVDLFSICCSIAVIFGGLVPYIPQYIKIKRSSNSDGFSTYVCLTLLIANILRIMFWIGHRFELPLLIQSFVIIAGMLAMMEICIRVRNRASSYTISAIGVSANHRRRIINGKMNEINNCDHDNNSLHNNESMPIYSVLSSSSSTAAASASRSPERFYSNAFWDWDDYFSYVKFLSLFTIIMSLLTYLLRNNHLYIESIGFVAVFTESMLGMPQLLRNYTKKSTVGMSVEMVVMWLSGDLFKTLYFILRQAPAQFYICGSIQVVVDIFILGQVFWYRRPNVTYSKLPRS